MHRIFILSPAHSGGERARLIFNPRAAFDLARRLQRGEEVPLGEIFSFLSGLYFRGKLAYSGFFGRPPKGLLPAYVITSNKGLLPAMELVTLEELRDFGGVPIDPKDARYALPLAASAERLSREVRGACQWVLLGSIGTSKYSELLLKHLSENLHFPADFVGRGDMSRGGLLLRSVAAGEELSYIPVRGAVRHGKRPARLQPPSLGNRPAIAGPAGE